MDIGIFGSISHVLPFRHPGETKQFKEQVGSAFRVLSLYKPDLEFAFNAYLFVENFECPDKNADLLSKFFDKFIARKDKILYKHDEEDDDDKKIVENDPNGPLREHFGIENVRLSLKLSSLLRN